MWRICLAATLVAQLGACNRLFGIHEIVGTADSGTVDGNPACAGGCACESDSDCSGSGVHVVCNIQPTSSQCTCASGYATGSDGMCDWVGVVANPGFVTSTAWTPYGPAVIDTANAGDLDPGVGEILDATCAGYGGFTQQVVMPRLSVSQPLVASTTYQIPESEGLDDFVTANAGITLGGNYLDGTPEFGNSQWLTTRQCLGQAAYAPETTTGSGVPIALGTFINEGACQSSASLLIDHMDIEPAMPGECPGFGVVLDGSAEGSGWVFTTDTESGDPDGSVAQIGKADGENGGPGIELSSTEVCDETIATTTMSVPTAASPTFSIWHTTSSPDLSIDLDGLPLQLDGNGGTTETYCLPPYQVGGVYTVIAENYDSVNGVDCGTKEGVDAVIDNLTLSTDMACGSDPAIADPGFESGHSLIGAQNVTDPEGIVEPIQDGDAHGGARDLLFEVTAICGGATWEAAEVTPAAQGSDGPALAFWYRFPAGGSAEFLATVYKAEFTAVRDGLWHQALACLDPNRAGRPSFTEFELYDQTDGVTCGTGVQQQEIAYIDDLSVVTDPSCPTQ